MTRLELSLGEVQSLCAKAARGAGRTHGTAQDAGFAVRWLCARGQDGAGLLLTLLHATDGAAHEDLVPGEGHAGPFCPLIMGAYAADRNETEVDVPVHCAELLAPFVEQGDGAERLEGAPPRAFVEAEVLAELEGFAARTYAPATEESRARGAGSGLSDND